MNTDYTMTESVVPGTHKGFRVRFGDSEFHTWEESFDTYTGAWIAFHNAQLFDDPNRIALNFTCPLFSHNQD